MFRKRVLVCVTEGEHVRVCVCERERDRQTDRQRQREYCHVLWLKVHSQVNGFDLY